MVSLRLLQTTCIILRLYRTYAKIHPKIENILVTSTCCTVLYVMSQTMNLSFSNLKMMEEVPEGDHNDNIKRSVSQTSVEYFVTSDLITIL